MCLGMGGGVSAASRVLVPDIQNNGLLEEKRQLREKRVRLKKHSEMSSASNILTSKIGIPSGVGANNLGGVI